MSVPSVIFIDTSVIDATGYNFDSEKVKAFISAGKSKQITVLMPMTTEAEIRRHIKQNVDSSLGALADVQRKVPFIRKWSWWPAKANLVSQGAELHRMAVHEWETFIKNFTVVPLGYSDIEMSDVMAWYDAQLPPFGKGKSKEFPDAFSFSSILKYSEKNGTSIALISKDKDFLTAAERYSSVMAFDSLESFVSALFSDDLRVRGLKQALTNGRNIILSAIKDAALNLDYYPVEDWSGDGSVDSLDINEITVEEYKVIAIGDRQCSVSFIAKADLIADLTCEVEDEVEVDGRYYDTTSRRKGEVDDVAKLSGILKLRLNEDWDSVSKVDLVVFDMTDVGIKAIPGMDRDYYDGYEE